MAQDEATTQSESYIHKIAQFGYRIDSDCQFILSLCLSRYVSGSQPSSQDAPLSPYSSSNRTSPAAKDRTLATNSGLGIGMASSVRRDLNDSTSRLSSTTSTSSTVIDHQPSSNTSTSRYSDASAPTFTSPDGVLSKVVGSLVDPEGSRNKWSCFNCNTVFARDTTIYVSPPSASNPNSDSVDKQTLKPGGEYFCKNCYTIKFAIANCSSRECGKPILGSTKEDGKFIKVSNGILYHGKCFKCVWCGKSKFKDGIEILIGISGDPVCEDDFGKSGKKKEYLKTEYNNKGSNQKIAGGDERYERKMMNRPNDQATSGLTRSESSKKKMGNSIAELSKRFSGSLSTSNNIISPTSPKSPILSSPTFKNQGFGLDQTTSSSKVEDTPLSPRGRGLESSQKIETGPPVTNWRNQGRTNSFSTRDQSPIKSPTLNSNIGKSPSFERFSEKVNHSPSIVSLSSKSNNGNTSDLKRSGSFNRSGSKSPTRPPRPLTAEFSGGNFNLANYKPSGLERKDSRSRSVSPVKMSRDDEEDESRIRGGNKFEREDLKKGTSKKSLDLSPPRTTFGNQKEEEEMKCSICHRGPFDAPGFDNNNEGTQEVQVVTLSGGINLHSSCFQCSLCHLVIDPKKSFVRLNPSELPESHQLASQNEPNLNFAHPNCAPIPKLDRPTPPSNSGTSLSAPISAVNTGGSWTSSNGGANDHATHQRAPRPSKNDGLDRTPPVTLYGAPPLPPNSSNHLDLNSISRSLSKDGSLDEERRKSRSPSPNRFKRPISPSKLSNSSLFNSNSSNANSMSGRKFQSTSGAAPPTRSTINVRRIPFSKEGEDSNPSSNNSISRNPAAGFFSKLSDSNSKSNDTGSSTSSNPISKFGGMSTCAGCGSKLSSLESIPGPRGTYWHRSCLVCKGKPVKKENNLGYASLKKVESICGKKLDSGAKVTVEGDVRCRDCFDRERKMVV